MRENAINRLFQSAHTHFLSSICSAGVPIIDRKCVCVCAASEAAYAVRFHYIHAHLRIRSQFIIIIGHRAALT